MIEALRAEREPYGPWMFGLGPEMVSPDRIGWWWKRAREISGHRRPLAPPRPAPLVGHRRHRPGPRRAHRRRPPRPRQPGDDPARVRPRVRCRRPGGRRQASATSSSAIHEAVAVHDAFVDESIRGRRYVMACVLAEARHLATLRPAMAGLAVYERVHFNNESDAQKRRVLEAVTRMPIRRAIVVCHRGRGVDGVRRAQRLPHSARRRTPAPPSSSAS